MDKYQYSLRFTLDPDSWSEIKENELVEFCQKAKIDDVAFIINSEELNRGHLTEKETEPWMEKIENVKIRLDKINVSTSLNPWTSLGHSDRGRVVSEQLGFDTMVDYKGEKAKLVACPLDDRWQNYISKMYEYFAKINPKFLWVEDDYRHFNHRPVEWGCFCERHMNVYQQKLEERFDRETFVKKILAPGKPTKYRKVYLEMARDEMIETARLIEEKVYKVSPETTVSLMTSQQDWHAVEGRDWEKLFDAFSGSKRWTGRTHLPAYNEVSPLVYGREFNRLPRVVADLMGTKGRTLPELENYMYSPYIKSNKFTQLQLESTALLGSEGIMMNLFDMMGNGIDMSYNLQSVLSESKEFMNELVQEKLDVDKIEGIKILFSETSVGVIENDSGKLSGLLPKEYNWEMIFGTFGISNRPYNIKKIDLLHDDVVAISGQLLRNLSDGEIERLFSENKIIIDGVTASILVERGLGNMIGARKGKWMAPHSEKQSYEQVDDGQVIDGVEKARMTMMQQLGPYFNIQYDNDIKLDVITNSYDEYNEFVGPAMVSVNNRVLVIPISDHEKYGWNSQYINYKEKIIKTWLEENTKVVFLKNSGPITLIKESEKVYLTNFSMDGTEKIKIRIPNLKINSENIEILSRGGKEKVQILDYTDNVATLDYQMDELETMRISL